jgi:hypothetical protein
VFEVALAYDIEVHHLNDVAAVDVYTRVLPRLAGCIAIGQNVLNTGIIRSNNLPKREQEWIALRSGIF